MRLFDYAFYSLYDLYLRKEGAKSNPTLGSSLAINALEISLLLGFAILSSTFTDYKIHEVLNITKNNFIIISCVLILLWQRVSYKIYQKRLDDIIKKYKNHPRNKWFRAWMLYIVALAFILVPIFLIKIFKFYGF